MRRAVAISASIAAATILHEGAAAESAGMNGFDFSYSIAGDAKVTPIQVFDDGARTYFQFKAGENVPAIFLVHKGKLDLAQIDSRTPYVVVSGVAQRFSLRSGAAIAGVDYVGARRNEPAVAGARAATERANEAGVPPGNVAAAGIDGESIEQLLAAIRNSSVRVTRPSAAYEEAQALEGIGGPAYRTVLRADVPFYRGHPSLGRLGTRALMELVAQARLADRVTVRARSDSAFLAQLAAARGRAIRDYLVSQAVHPEKIEIVEDRAAKASGSRDVFLCEVDLDRSVEPAAARAANNGGSAAGIADRRAVKREAQRSPDLMPVLVAAMTLMKEGGVSQDTAAAVLASVISRQDNASRSGVEALPRTPLWEMSRTDGTLRSALSRWADASGWQLSWEVPFDYPINLGAQFQGSFEEAVASVAKSLEQAEMPIQVTFYRANKVVRVLAGGGQKK